MDTVRNTIAADAAGVARSVLERWDRILSEEPWWSTSHVDSDHLVELVRATADAALAEDVDEGISTRFIETALRHGRDRRDDGHRDTVIHQEFVLLRRALREDLRERCGMAPGTHEATSRLDGALNHAEIASLHGYHERELPPESALHAPDRLRREWVRIREGWPLAE